MLILPESVEDWAELLRQVLRDIVFDIRFEVRPHFVNALGDVETVPVGYEFTLSNCAPQTAAASDWSPPLPVSFRRWQTRPKKLPEKPVAAGCRRSARMIPCHSTEDQ